MGTPLQPGKSKTAPAPRTPSTWGILGQGSGQRKWEAGRGYFETTGLGRGPPWKSHLAFWEPISGLGLLPSRSTEKGGKGKGKKEGTQEASGRSRETARAHTHRNRRKGKDPETPRCWHTETGRTGRAQAWHHSAYLSLAPMGLGRLPPAPWAPLCSSPGGRVKGLQAPPRGRLPCRSSMPQLCPVPPPHPHCLGASWGLRLLLPLCCPAGGGISGFRRWMETSAPLIVDSAAEGGRGLVLKEGVQGLRNWGEPAAEEQASRPESLVAESERAQGSGGGCGAAGSGGPGTHPSLYLMCVI